MLINMDVYSGMRMPGVPLLRVHCYCILELIMNIIIFSTKMMF